jgi:hypothetical protein
VELSQPLRAADVRSARPTCEQARGARFLRRMRVTVDQPGLLPDLVSFLTERVDVIATKESATEVAVSILGSRASPHDQDELERRLEEWRRNHPGVHLRVTAGDATVHSSRDSRRSPGKPRS